MSKVKRVSALLLALLMVFGMCLPDGLVTTAYAAGLGTVLPSSLFI